MDHVSSISFSRIQQSSVLPDTTQYTRYIAAVVAMLLTPGFARYLLGILLRLIFIMGITVASTMSRFLICRSFVTSFELEVFFSDFDISLSVLCGDTYVPGRLYLQGVSQVSRRLVTTKVVPL